MSLTSSFSKYREIEEDDLFEEEDVSASFVQDEISEEYQNSVTISESDSDEEEEIVKVKRKSKKRIIISSDSDDSEIEQERQLRSSHSHKNNSKSSIVTSDDSVVYESDEQFPSTSSNSAAQQFASETDEEENFIERQALSPRTRQSINGFRPRDLSSDESEERVVDDDGVQPPSPIATSKSNSKIAADSIFSDLEDELHSHDPVPESVENRNPTILNRTSANFNVSIANKHSSTLSENDKNLQPAVSSPIQEEISDKNDKSNCEVVEISSSTDSSVQMTSTPTVPKEFQSKIKPEVIGTPRSTRPITKLVSKEYYEKELQKLEELKNDLIVCDNLMDTFGSKLPDKGKRMSGRSEELKQKIKRQVELMSTLVIEEDKKDFGKAPLNRNAPSWSELSAAVNEIQPKYTGKVGLANFNTQKALTVDRLKDIHGSLETCPAEDVLAEPPKGLKVNLMNHQRHALAWINWREKQRPRGGILADDMGLGKTLTMISLVLDANQKKEITDENSETSSNEDEYRADKKPGWSTKGRRDYYNGGTLVVCPASLVRQWEGEVEKHTKRNLISVCVHHGNNRDTKPRHLSKYDMVVTTYNIASRENKSHGALFGIKWERIILDEAHVIRNHKSQSSDGVCQLRGRYRWALTGTPIHNKEMDLYAILKFLRCSPFDDLAHWKKWIDNKSAGGQQRLYTLMKSLMLRRTKAQLQENGTLNCLPEKQTDLIEVILDKEEMNVYQRIMIFSRTLFSQYLYQRAEKNNDLIYKPQGDRGTFLQTKDPNGAFFKMHLKMVKLHGAKEIQTHQILVLLLRLRQICCHPGLIDSMLEDEDNTNPTDNSETSHPEIDLLEQLDKLKINENESGDSLTQSLDGSKEEAISKASSKVLLKTNPVFNLDRPSSKIKKVLQVLEEKVLSSGDKAIVVSQWTSVLDILRKHLCTNRVPILCLNGSVPVHKRQEIVTNFNDAKNSSKILLLSLTAGGVGLNLVGANHLLLMDLHWNPQLESQAQDRIYRVGQEKPVHVYKFMCKNTVEERIKALQDHKLGIANGVLTGARAEGSKLSLDDLMGLFGM